MFGIAPPEYCNSEENRRRVLPYHYYPTKNGYGNYNRECDHILNEQKRADETKTIGHRFSTERLIFRSWTHSFNFSFFNPSWDLPAT